MMYYNNYGGNFSEGIREGIKNSFRKGSSLTRLIYINCGIFLALKLIYIMMLLLGKGEEFYPTLLEKCRELPVDLICLSLSVTQMLNSAMEKELRDICNDLEKQGKIICASECNNAKDTIPAIYKSVIGVGELLPDAKKKVLVDRAASVQVLADISPIFVAGKSGRYNFFKGTSKGNAYVAGILARAMQTAPNIKSIQEALNILEKTDDPLEEIDLEYVGKLQTDEVGQRQCEVE